MKATDGKKWWRTKKAIGTKKDRSAVKGSRDGGKRRPLVPSPYLTPTLTLNKHPHTPTHTFRVIFQGSSKKDPSTRLLFVDLL